MSITTVAIATGFLGCTTQSSDDRSGDEPTNDSSPVDDSGVSGTEDPCGLAANIGLEIGQCAPDFTLIDSVGQPYNLYAQRGKLALVDLSAIW